MFHIVRGYLKGKCRAVSIISITVAIIIAVSMGLTSKETNSDVIIRINSQSVNKEEVTLLATQLKGKIYSELISINGERIVDDIWKANYNGRQGIEIYKEKIIEYITDIKVVQGLAVEYRVVDSISYEDFLIDLENENKRRLIAYENNEPIYGPKQYAISVFYDLIHQNRIEELKKKIIDVKADTEYDSLLDTKVTEAVVEYDRDVFDSLVTQICYQ